jgi:hypothetical protein
MEDLKEGNVYSIEWIDGDYKTECVYIREHRGFLIFKDDKGMKVFCRPSSLRKVTLL